MDACSAPGNNNANAATDGSAAREFVKDQKSPLRNIIIAIADSAPEAAQ